MADDEGVIAVDGFTIRAATREDIVPLLGVLATTSYVDPMTAEKLEGLIKRQSHHRPEHGHMACCVCRGDRVVGWLLIQFFLQFFPRPWENPDLGADEVSTISLDVVLAPPVRRNELSKKVHARVHEVHNADGAIKQEFALVRDDNIPGKAAAASVGMRPGTKHQARGTNHLWQNFYRPL